MITDERTITPSVRSRNQDSDINKGGHSVNSSFKRLNSIKFQDIMTVLDTLNIIHGTIEKFNQKFKT